MIDKDFRFIINDNNTKPAKFITILSGKKRREIQELIGKAPVDGSVVKTMNLIKEKGLMSNHEASIEMLREGEVSAEDLLRIQGGNYIPENSEDYYTFVYDFFRLLLSDDQKPDIKKGMEDYYKFMDNQDFIELESIIDSFRKKAKL